MHFLKSVRTRFQSYHLKSGIFHFNRGEFKQAADFFKRALKEDGLQEDEPATARSLLTQTYLGWGRELQEQEDRVGALEKLEAALAISPEYPDIHCLRGSLLAELDQEEAAREAFERALEINGDYVEARVYLGYRLLDDGQAEEAAAQFEQAFLLRVKQIERPFFEGKAALLEGDPERGRRLIQKAFDHRPWEAERQFHRGLRALRHERWFEAIESLQAAIDLDTPYADLFNFLGIAYCETARPEDACEAFEQALEINDGFLAARLNLAFTLFEEGALGRAQDEVDRILEQAPACTPALALTEELAEAARTPRKA